MHRFDNPTEIDTITAWMADGNCRNYPPAVFFPSDGVGVDRARKICIDCPVAAKCLEYALEERIEHGVMVEDWGGSVGCIPVSATTGAARAKMGMRESAPARASMPTITSISASM